MYNLDVVSFISSLMVDMWST